MSSGPVRHELVADSVVARSLASSGVLKGVVHPEGLSTQ